MTATAPEPATTLLVIAKQPVPGRVKTRLVPPCSHEQAASLAEAALADTLRAVLATPARRRVLVLDGEPGPWLPAGFDIAAQCEGPLDERLAARARELATVLSPVGSGTGAGVLGVTP